MNDQQRRDYNSHLAVRTLCDKATSLARAPIATAKSKPATPPAPTP